MSKYSVTTQSHASPAVPATATAFKTLINLSAATAALRKGWIYDVAVGTDGTPADNAMVFQIDRQTTLGTGGQTATITPLDSTDPAAGLVGTINIATTEPTTTAGTALLVLGINQRATYRWVAAPGGELVVPGTNLAGLGLRVKSPAYTGTATGAIHFWE